MHEMQSIATDDRGVCLSVMQATMHPVNVATHSRVLSDRRTYSIIVSVTFHPNRASEVQSCPITVARLAQMQLRLLPSMTYICG